MATSRYLSTTSPSNRSPPDSKNSQCSGSATGNPRNKCALKPGHSLMDWIRLGNSGCDLAGTKGVITPVNEEELSKHCTRDDAWIAIRGRVYNITPYMDFHPGGVDELMRGVGRDATKLFDEMHAWVNYDQLLRKCLIGPLENIVKIDPWIKKNSILSVCPRQAAVPFLSWFQRKLEVTLGIYIEEFCNPGLIITRTKNNHLHVEVLIKHISHYNEVQMDGYLIWPPTAVNVLNESGVIRVNFTKASSERFCANMIHNKTRQDDPEDDSYHIFEIEKKLDFNHDSTAVALRSKEDLIIWCPVGHHVTFVSQIKDRQVSRSYTPVPQSFCATKSDSDFGLHFLLKTYKNGLMSSRINDMATGATIKLSEPRGNLPLKTFANHTRIILLAAGSGLTPMLGLITHLLERKQNKIDHLLLVYFNKTEDDIWCRDVLKDLQEKDERFHLKHVLSNPSTEWTGLKGQINLGLVSDLNDEHFTMACVCGPRLFNSSAEEILRILEFPKDAVHIFDG